MWQGLKTFSEERLTTWKKVQIEPRKSNYEFVLHVTPPPCLSNKTHFIFSLYPTLSFPGITPWEGNVIVVMLLGFICLLCDSLTLFAHKYKIDFLTPMLSAASEKVLNRTEKRQASSSIFQSVNSCCLLYWFSPEATTLSWVVGRLLSWRSSLHLFEV